MLVQTCKNQIFEENKAFECIFFIEMKYSRFQNRLADLKKIPNPLIFAYEHYDFLKKMLIFHIF